MKNKLLQQKQEILNRYIGGFKSDAIISLDDMSDEIDLAEFERSNAIAAELKNRDIKLLASIDRALARVEAGTYSDCEDCEEPIESKRLEVMNLTTTCVPCQDKREKRARTHVTPIKGSANTMNLEANDSVIDMELVKMVKSL